MATTGQLLSKALRGEQLMESEIMQIERAWDEQEAYSLKLRDWLAENNGVVKPEFPIQVIYSEILSANAVNIVIDIPSVFRHVLIIGSGRTTYTGSVAENIAVQFNLDTGATYDLETMYRLDNTASGGQNLSATAFSIGTFPTADADAGASGNAFGIFPHVGSDLWKGGTGIGGGYFDATAGAIVFTDYGTWESTAKITSITLFPESSPTSSFLLGTAISVYGLL